MVCRHSRGKDCEVCASFVKICTQRWAFDMTADDTLPRRRAAFSYFDGLNVREINLLLAGCQGASKNQPIKDIRWVEMIEVSIPMLPSLQQASSQTPASSLSQWQAKDLNEKKFASAKSSAILATLWSQLWASPVRGDPVSKIRIILMSS
jgi:hypothetical protein